MVEAALEHLSKAIEDKTLSGNHLKHIARAIAIIKEERELIRTEDAAFRAQWMPENVTA